MTINEIRTSLPPTPHDDRSVYAWQMALLKSLTRLHSVRQYACLDHDRNILVLDLLSKGDFGFAWKMTYDKSIAPTVGHHAAQVFLTVMEFANAHFEFHEYQEQTEFDQLVDALPCIESKEFHECAAQLFAEGTVPERVWEFLLMLCGIWAAIDSNPKQSLTLALERRKFA